MKLTPDDPRLSSYLLGELSAEDAAEIDRVAAADPAIQVSLSELQKTMSFLSGTLNGLAEHKLLPSQRQHVLRAGRDADQEGKVVELASARRSMRPWMTGLAAAATVTIAALLLNRMGDGVGGDGGIAWADEIALLPMPGPSTGGGMTMPGKGSTAEVEMARQIKSRGSAFLGEVARKLEEVRLPEVERLPAPTELSGFSDAASLRLPVVIGDSSPAWVNRWMQERGELPPKRLIRVEEFINAVSLRTSKEFEGLAVGVETMDCPWREGAILVGVQLTAGESEVSDLELHSVSSASRRVLGSFSRRSDSELPSLLPASRSTLVMLELENVDQSAGVIDLRKNDNKLTIQVPSEEAKPSAEMARAVTMAGYALWLRGEIADEALDATLAEADQVDPGAIHRELQRGIDQARALTEAGR